MAVEKPADKKTGAKKFKGVRRKREAIPADFIN